MELIGSVNLFRFTGDIFHLLAISILLVKILKSGSCAGISGKSQVLYTIVFVARYSDLFTTFLSLYNTAFNVTFITLSASTVLLIFIVFRKTYDRKSDAFPIGFLLLPAAVLAFYINYEFTVYEVLWTFSIYLESVAILPQLLMISELGEVGITICHYLFALGSYRIFYLIHWIWRYNHDYHYDPISVCSGIVQVILYWKFFYVYFTKVLKARSIFNRMENESVLDRLRESVHKEFCVNETLDKIVEPSIENWSEKKRDASSHSMIYSVDV